MRHYKPIVLITLFTWMGCQYLPWGKPEPNPIFVGEPETILVEPPEDSFDVDYRWNILDLPDESMLVPDFSSSSNVFTFTADVEGDYAFSVIVESYGVEVSESVYYYNAVEDTTVVPRKRVSPEVAAEKLVRETVPAPATPMPAPTVTTPSAVTPTTQPKAAPAKPKPRPAARPAPARRAVPKDIVPGHFTIQVSSWKSAKQAQAALQKLTELGYDAYIQRIWLEERDEAWWRVRMGDFTNIEEAKRMRNTLAQTFAGAWVDNIRKENVKGAQ